jgi:YHS domain-containing protein
VSPGSREVERILARAGVADDTTHGSSLTNGRHVMEIDPVCGMEVDPATAEWKWDFEGTTYYFCAKGCMEDFIEDPQAHLG